MTILKIPATIENISTRMDRTIKIVISTQEMTSEQSAILLGLHQKFGWMLMSLNDISDKDIPTEQLPETSTKSQSQRIRACIFKIWADNTDKSQPFEEFYRIKTEKIIDYLKEQIN